MSFFQYVVPDHIVTCRELNFPLLVLPEDEAKIILARSRLSSHYRPHKKLTYQKLATPSRPVQRTKSQLR